jgi:hypothetical protein
MPGQTIQQYVRDRWLGELHDLGVEVIPLARLFGVDGDSVYLQHTTAGSPIICEDVETLVTALGHESVDALADELKGWSGNVLRIGDAAAARTVEEAVLDGLEAGNTV